MRECWAEIEPVLKADSIDYITRLALKNHLEATRFDVQKPISRRQQERRPEHAFTALAEAAETWRQLPTIHLANESRPALSDYTDADPYSPRR